MATVTQISIKERIGDVKISTNMGDTYVRKETSRASVSEGNLVIFAVKGDEVFSKTPLLKVTDPDLIISVKDVNDVDIPWTDFFHLAKILSDVLL